MRKLLVVDDEQEIRESVIGGLEGLFEFDEASTGTEAVEKIKGCKYDIVLLDLKLPGMDGSEVLAEVKNFNPATQVIIMTGHAQLFDVISLLDLGANDMLLKPFRLAELRKLVKHTTDKLDRWDKVLKEIRSGV